MDQNRTDNTDKPKKSKETIINMIIMALFISVIGYLGYSFIWGKDTIPNNQQETVDITIYLSNLDVQRGEEDCSTVFPTTRTIQKTDAMAAAALEQLFKGTTTKEERNGLHTGINPEFTIKKLTINMGIATVELHDSLEFLGYSPCTATAIKAQITKTLEQFSNVDTVVITVNNKADDL